jgi:transcriptional regulator with XRE-family HTH domain
VPPQDGDRALENIGRRIAEIRRVRGFTQAQIAEAAGVSIGRWQALERGTQNPTVRTLLRVCSLLDVELVQLLELPRSRAPRRTGRPRKV